MTWNTRGQLWKKSKYHLDFPLAAGHHKEVSSYDYIECSSMNENILKFFFQRV